MEEHLIESILIADCGATTTRVVLLDIVNGQYRFVSAGQALTTAEPPWSDTTVGLVRAVAEVEAITGRRLIGENGRLRVPSERLGTGIDLFLATTSAAAPLRTVLAGLVEDLSLASAQRVALSTYTIIQDTLSLKDRRSDEERIHQLVALAPDLFLVTGGTDGGATNTVLQMVETIAAAIPLMSHRSNPPTVVFAGNAELRSKVAEILNGCQYRTAANVRPKAEIECLAPAQAEVVAVLKDNQFIDLPGGRELSGLCQGTLIPTAQAFGWTVSYLGEALETNIVGVDVGSASVTMGTYVDGASQLIVRSDLGIGYHLPRLLEEIGAQQVLRWHPADLAPDAAADYAGHKSLLPQTLPMTSDDLLMELAFARELVHRLQLAAFPSRFITSGDGLAPRIGMILAAGAVLAHTPRPGQAALVLLDSLQPIGLCTLALDPHGLASALGACARISPVAAVQVIDSGAFRELGSVVAPTGKANPGQVVLQLIMSYENGSKLEVEVEYGSLEVLPLAPGQHADLSLQPLKRFDVGEGPGRSCRRRVYGGAVGLMVDARGRPLRLPSSPEDRRAKIQQWLWDMGG